MSTKNLVQAFKFIEQFLSVSMLNNLLQNYAYLNFEWGLFLSIVILLMQGWKNM